MHPTPSLTQFALLLALYTLAQAKCVYNIGEDRIPLHVDS